MKTKFHLLLTLLLTLVAQVTLAQSKTITGTITDQDGLPLPGVNVAVQGTNAGTQTDFDGVYSIEASEGDVLSFTYVGFSSQSITVGASNEVNITMEAGETLDEVVVVGYGTSTKQAFAGTAATVKAEQIEAKSYSNVSQSLAGEVAGVTVINTSGQPGTTSTVRIRGFGSVNGNRAPLYVVDGVPFSGDLNSINPADIASTTVLKDATATAIYGSRGANGVILITTKKGKAGQDYIEFDIKSGVNSQLIPRYDVIKSPETYIATVWEGIYNRGVINGVADPVAYANSNLFTDNYIPAGYNMWNVADGGELIDPVTRMVRPSVSRRYSPQRYEDAAFDSAFRTEANLRMGGGSDKTQYFVSAGYLADDGYAINTSYDRATTRLNVTSDVRDWLTVGANIGYAYSESVNNGQTNGSENLFEFSDKMAPIFPVFLRDDNYQLVDDPIFGGYQYDYGTASGFRARPNANQLNPIGSALYDFVGTDRHELNGSFSLDVKFTDHLTFETRFGAQYAINHYKSYSNPFYGGASLDEVKGSLFVSDTETITKNFLQLLRYKNQFGDHSLEVLAAHESNDYHLSNRTASKQTVVLPGLLELDNFIKDPGVPGGYSNGRTIESYFSQINYDYLDKYYFTGSVRRDGSSRFVNDKWGTFGSVGAAWVVSNEDFLNSDFLTFFKLKASYGITGDQAGVGFYSGYDTFNTGILGGTYSISARDNGNPNLTWETSNMLQVGAEFTLGNIIDGSIDFYDKITDNLIFDRRVAPSQGIAIVTVNDGELRNQGLEIDLTGHIFKTNDFMLDLNVNGTLFNNEIKTMPIDPTTGLPRIIDVSPGSYAYSKGSSIYDFYMREWAGVDPSDGAPMWYQYFNDANGNQVLDANEDAIEDLTSYLIDNEDATVERQITKTYSQATNKYVGKSSVPTVRGAFRLYGKFKNFDFSTQFLYSLGGWAYDAQYAELLSDRFGAAGNNYHRDILNRWQNPGDITDVPRLSDGIDQNSISQSTRFLVKSDYLALNNARIGYTFSQDLLGSTGIDALNLFVSGDNLFIKSARDGFNPTTSETGNTGRGLYAPLTTVTLGARVRF